MSFDIQGIKSMPRKLKKESQVKKGEIISASEEIEKVKREMNDDKWTDDMMDKAGAYGFEKLKEVIGKRRTWFKIIEEDFDMLVLSTDKHGDCKRGIPGYKDMREAKEIEVILNNNIENDDFDVFTTNLEASTEIIIMSNR